MNYALKLRKIGQLKWACRAIVALATATSVWANSLTAQHNTASVVIMVIAPLIVMATFELVSRIPLRGSWILKFIRPTTTAALMAGAAYLSYWHQRDAFLRYSDDLNTAYILPGLIDGLMVVAAVSLIELNAHCEELEARQAGLAVVITKANAPIQATKVRVLSGKERVAEILAKYPDMAVKEIAAKANVSEGYAYPLVKQLRQTRDAVEVN